MDRTWTQMTTPELIEILTKLAVDQKKFPEKIDEDIYWFQYSLRMHSENCKICELQKDSIREYFIEKGLDKFLDLLDDKESRVEWAKIIIESP